MATPSLQDGIDKAGSPIRLLWKPNAEPWTPEVVEREYAGWRQEQAAWHEGVALLNLSHHMYDMWIEGPDATRVLAEYGANNFEKFAVGQAKQYVPVTRDGKIVTDGILARHARTSTSSAACPPPSTGCGTTPRRRATTSPSRPTRPPRSARAAVTRSCSAIRSRARRHSI